MSDWMSEAGKASGARAAGLDAAQRQERERISRAAIWAVTAIGGSLWFVVCESYGAPWWVCTLPPLAVGGAVAWKFGLG